VSDEGWLSPAELATWRAYLASNLLLMRTLDRQLQHDSGIAHTHYGVLVQLAERPGRTARVTELAALMDHSQSRMSHAVGRLERSGWVRRELDPTDRRVVHVVLTDQGWDVLRQAAPGHVRCVRESLFDGLTAEQLQVFREVCEMMIARLAADYESRAESYWAG
jgi:DNA-binding MarR family transcriptional regulator